MIKIEKDLDLVPNSLQTPYQEHFNGKIPLPSKTTHTRRLEVINGKKYISNDLYNSRYKQRDVKEKLILIYNNKCAFCENKVESFHVEHYRPKNIYYWLAYSWDNLLLACATCNQFKDEKFDLAGTKVDFTNNPTDLKAINSLSPKYDKIEQPLLVNPEIFDPSEHIEFQQSGNLQSANNRVDHTIKQCKINRSYLNDQRRHILNVFKRDIHSVALENQTEEEQLIAIKTIVRKFINDSQDKESTFIAFRTFMIKNWLNSTIKEIIR